MAPEELEPFLKHAKMGWGGVILALICAGIAMIGFLDPEAGLGIQLGLAIPFGLLTLVFLFVSLRPPSSHPFIRTLKERTNSIVWVYVTEQSVNGVHANTFLNIALDDRKRVALAIGKSDPKELLAHLERLVPHATQGFSQELEQRYNQSPASLRRV